MNHALVHLVAGARPNFMKVAPLYHNLRRQRWCTPVLVHTGQHYDPNLSEAFLRDLGLNEPDHYLGVGSGSHAKQTAAIMVAYERLCLEQRPDWVVVVGDVNSTLACTLAAKKLCVSVAHLEAGLRSGDRSMPEEINRIVTDALADLLWTPSPDADENLRREGVADRRIVRVGNIMIDSFVMLHDKIKAEKAAAKFGFAPRTYGIVTLHRPANVDDASALTELVSALVEVGKSLPLVFPVHPRTRNRLEACELWETLTRSLGIYLIDPVSYVPFMSLLCGAMLVITDSGGIQEETTYLNIPCLTLRESTERPITVTQGTNRLARPADVGWCVEQVLAGRWPDAVRPEFWDGRTAERAALSLKRATGG